MSKQEKSVQANVVQEPPMEELEVGGALYATRLTSKFRSRKMWERPDQRKVTAVIPGTIQKLMVSEGDEVVAGESMMILEAMKMRNEIKAFQQGVVKKINVKEGEQVPKSHLLLEFK
ncbi:MAG: acetyl-CoA carboxylase biotin carboxyl carrier protein subunit [Bacteroidetes bacterium]|nr:acetyl-CoA carboxylase biotin carboxyl carrier protein subunit [Bacteroidota bacterium]